MRSAYKIIYPIYFVPSIRDTKCKEIKIKIKNIKIKKKEEVIEKYLRAIEWIVYVARSLQWPAFLGNNIFLTFDRSNRMRNAIISFYLPSQNGHRPHIYFDINLCFSSYFKPFNGMAFDDIYGSSCMCDAVSYRCWHFGAIFCGANHKWNGHLVRMFCRHP